MTNLDALETAVLDAPDEDAPRRTFAAAIATTDPARAELIELQLAMAGWRKARLRPAAWEATAIREHALLRDHAARWSAAVGPLAARCRFLRGFVELVELEATTYLRTAPRLYRAAPILHLDLTGVKTVAAALFDSPALARIHSLRLTNNALDDEDARRLAASPHLGNLGWLDLGRNRIGMDGLEALAASPHLPRLRYVGFADNAIPDPMPAHADEYDADTAVGEELARRFGRRPWLAASPPRAPWPPERDAP